MLNVDVAILNTNLEMTMAIKCKTEFHKQILIAWIELSSKEPVTYKEIINQHIFVNKFIIINREIIKTLLIPV